MVVKRTLTRPGQNVEVNRNEFIVDGGKDYKNEGSPFKNKNTAGRKKLF